MILHFLSYIFVSKYDFGCFNLAGETSGKHFSLDLLMTLPALGSRRARNPLCPEGLLPPRFLTHPPSGAYFMWLWERPFFNKKNIISARCSARKFAGTYRLLGVWLLKRSSAYRLLTWAQRYGTKTGKSYCVCGQCFYWTYMLSSWNMFHWAYHEDQCTMDLELCWIRCGWRIFCSYLGKKSRLISWRCMRWMYKLSFQVVFFCCVNTWWISYMVIESYTYFSWRLRLLRTSFVERDSSWEQPALRPCFRLEHFRSQKCG